MTDLIFYHRVPSRGQTVRWMLEELGEPYETRVLDFEKDGQHGSEFLAINPMGKVPTITHEGAPVSESAAICTYLADAYPDAGLGVPIGDADRGTYLKWLFFAPSCFEPAVFEHMMPREGTSPLSMGFSSYDLVMDVLTDALKEGPYLMGEHFTAVDVVIGSGLRWAGWM
ncbi:MAG: glutathione S-transferase family protein, partial [Proteobacteria bacterium]|nr:glutathione S-transferase family protein [Pseudomonadota bacterium]